jgi:hypothetical protein
MKVNPLGTLDSEDYERLQAAASQSPPKVGSNIDNCVPQVVYYIRGDYDFSRIRSLYIPDFRSLDEEADARLATNTANDLSSLLLQKGLFDRAERLQQAGTDMTLTGAIIRYQPITRGKKTNAIGSGLAWCGFCVMEFKLVDSKTNDRIGAIQINHVTMRADFPLHVSAGSTKPETQIPEFVSTIFERMRFGQITGTNDKWSDCTSVDNGKSLLEMMCR